MSFEVDDASLLASASGVLAPARPKRRREKLKAKKAKTQRTPPPDRWANGIDWPVAIWIVVVHVGALAAPFFFTWKGVAIMFALYWLTGSIGVCMGYHRHLTHGSFATYKPMRWLLAFIGGLSGEGSALTWVANHRKHHVLSDKEGDPHSPRDGGLWSHMLWFVPDFGRKHYDELTTRYAPDLLKDPVLRFLHLMFLPSHVAMGVLLLAVGWLGWDLNTGISFVAWGSFLRTVVVLHVTWFVNSATHMWGYRNYKTTDDSTNLWWVGLLAFGEGWHNNHHAFQRMAKHGHKWWEVDVTYWAILVLEKTGLAWDVVHDVPQRKKLIVDG
jgi:stearoyl-CoA desaturase (delta-9 desaturase)